MLRGDRSLPGARHQIRRVYDKDIFLLTKFTFKVQKSGIVFLRTGGWFPRCRIGGRDIRLLETWIVDPRANEWAASVQIGAEFYINFSYRRLGDLVRISGNVLSL